MKTRTIIQIHTIQRTTVGQLIALCDDGTLWYCEMPYGGPKADWQPLDNVPQFPSQVAAMARPENCTAEEHAERIASADHANR